MSFLENLKDATIGSSGYARLARDPRAGFGFLALLLAIVMTINGYINMVQMRRATAVLARQMETWPDFGVKNGQFYFDGPMPFQQTGADGSLLIIDTTGQTTPADLANRQGVLVTREKLYMVEPGVRDRELDFALLKSDTTRADIQRLLAAGPERLLVFAYLFLYLFQLAFKGIDAIILALIALLYGSIARRRVTFELGFKLALYAMSLPIIIQWIWPGFRSWSTTGFTVWWSLATIYLLLGLRAYWASESQEGLVPG